MAFAITNLAQFVASDFEGLPGIGATATGGPAGASASIADLSVAAAGITDSAIIDFGNTYNSFRAYVYLKTTAGTASVAVGLQLSNSATFATATDVHTLDSKYIDILLTTQKVELVLFGLAAVNTGYRYARVHFSTGSGTSGTADIIFYAA